MTIRVAELVGDANALGVISMSLYDTNPVYIVSVACEEIKWPKKNRKLFDKCNIRWLLQCSIESNYLMITITLLET